jgi:hypothetical protein
MTASDSGDMGGRIAREWREITAAFEPPVLVVSTVVGRGMYSLGEAVQERFLDPSG